ncbi:hypothetical protein PHYSODRAFT_323605 [Phytophthora sojae]|uniref:Uncharacterized protein n=1 Tax=Phytophthora sojae (strain P6497) TaxID=1094619 RepID=G4YLA8_PHYSP|nr:hypothetical protein PHYSODRAFT_323605 [Phytophthora sojae]EGZ30176.1 hypothetical protein PHYSODRAFT_323605 [Phytophthora sojae]|eukprot:XP_009517451.1 hypothetical protein PHYSODRAFT_323605 [Phytophthora sojae]
MDPSKPSNSMNMPHMPAPSTMPMRQEQVQQEVLERVCPASSTTSTVDMAPMRKMPSRLTRKMAHTMAARPPRDTEAMEQEQLEEEEELMQEALALLADCQDDDYEADISRLLLPEPIPSTTETQPVPLPLPLGANPTVGASFSEEIPSVTPALAASSPVKKTPTSAAKQQRNKMAPATAHLPLLHLSSSTTVRDMVR